MVEKKIKCGKKYQKKGRKENYEIKQPYGCANNSIGAMDAWLVVEQYLWGHRDNSIGAMDANLVVGKFLGYFWCWMIYEACFILLVDSCHGF